MRGYREQGSRGKGRGEHTNSDIAVVLIEGDEIHSHGECVVDAAQKVIPSISQFPISPLLIRDVDTVDDEVVVIVVVVLVDDDDDDDDVKWRIRVGGSL